MKVNTVIRLLRGLYATWQGCDFETVIMTWRIERVHFVAIFHGDHRDAISIEAKSFESCIRGLAHLLIARTLSDEMGNAAILRDLLVLLTADCVEDAPFRSGEVKILEELKGTSFEETLKAVWAPQM